MISSAFIVAYTSGFLHAMAEGWRKDGGWVAEVADGWRIRSFILIDALNPKSMPEHGLENKMDSTRPTHSFKLRITVMNDDSKPAIFVDLPAPLGPTMARHRPCGNGKLTPSNTNGSLGL